MHLQAAQAAKSGDYQPFSLLIRRLCWRRK